MKKTFGIIFTFLFLFTLNAQNAKIYLWKDVQGMKHQPSFMLYHAPEVQNSGTAVIICPGGSYHHLGLYNEGYCSAQWFASKGISAFTLKYRTHESFYHHPAMLEDIQRAIQIVRENASSYGIDPNKIGVIGYSAGGHLVTMAGAFFETKNELTKLGLDSDVSIRPDFVMPIYPVVSMQDDIAHKWSRHSLLGFPNQAQKDEFSMEMNIPDNMPPTYIVCCKDDRVVKYENSLRLYDTIKSKNIPDSRLTVYEWGNHGFGMLDNDFMDEFHWNEPLLEWIEEIGMWEKPDFIKNPDNSDEDESDYEDD